MKWLLPVALFLLLPILARGAEITVSCTPSTLFEAVCRTPTDCDPPQPIPDDAAPVFKLYKPNQTTPLATDTQCVFKRTNVGPGTYTHYVTESINDAESRPSNSVTTVVGSPAPPPSPTPAPPDTTLSGPVFKTTSTVVYTITNGNNRLVFLIVGSVPLGTECDPTQYANGFSVVPVSTVTWDGPAKPKTVLARCQ